MPLARWIVSVVISLFTMAAYAQPLHTVAVPPRSPNEIDLLVGGENTSNTLILTLNNNRTALLTVGITVYDLTGNQHDLRPITLIANESFRTNFSDMLRDQGLNLLTLGWVKVTYEGITLELGAQLTLFPAGSHTGVDSPRSLASDFKSSRRVAAFSLPFDASAWLSLINVDEAGVTVTAKCGAVPRQILLPARATIRIPIASPALSLGASTNRAVFCDIATDQQLSALRSIGTVTTAGGEAYPIRFYDPSTATFPELTSTGLRSAATAHVVVANVTDNEVTVRPIVREASLHNIVSETLPEIHLAAREARVLPLNDSLKHFSAQGIPLVTLTVATMAEKGAIVGAVTQIDANGLVEDVPLRTSNPPATARGSYPLRWDDDYTNMVTVTNTSSRRLRLGGAITAKSTVYVLTRVDIDPGATYVIDVDKLKREQIKDVNGTLLPIDATYGKLHWIEMGLGKNAGLLGRQSLSSVHNRLRSSFSCGSTCYYSFDGHPFYDPSPFMELAIQGSQAGYVSSHSSQVNGPSYTYPLAYNNDIYLDNPNILQIGGDSADGFMVSAMQPGTTRMVYYQTINTPYYVPSEETCYDNVSYPAQEATGSTDDLTPQIFSIDPTFWPPGSSQQVTITGINFGGGTPTLNLSPSGGISYSVLSSTPSQIVATVSVAQATPDEDVSVSVTSHGQSGTGFAAGSSGASATSGPAFGLVRGEVPGGERTVIGWVNGALIGLPPSYNVDLSSSLNNGGRNCSFLLAFWTAGFRRYLNSSADEDYANRWLLVNSANAAPPAQIDVRQQQYIGDFRLLATFGPSRTGASIGATPDPCHVIGRVPADTHPENGNIGISPSGRHSQVTEGRLGDKGRRVNATINHRDRDNVAWIWSGIQYDGNGGFYSGNHQVFPTYSMYQDGTKIDEVQQVDPSTFIGLPSSSQLHFNELP